MKIVRVSDNAVLSELEFRQANPNVSFPEDLSGVDLTGYGCVPFVKTVRPTPGQWKRVVELPPVGGVQQWGEEPMTEAEITEAFIVALDSLYNARAKEKQYDNRITCAIRAGYAGPFQAEGIAFAQWMDACNAYGYQQLALVMTGQRAIPTLDEFLAELPVLTWPT